MEAGSCTNISIKLEEGLVIMVIPQLRVRGQSLQEHLMHGYCLLECRQILSRPERGRGGEGGKKRGGEEGGEGWDKED